MKQLNIQIEDEQHEWIRVKAFEENRSMAEIVREAISKYMGEVNKMTTAEKIAAMLGDDGERWEADGKTLDDLCGEHGATVSCKDDLMRYLFPDGSAIVAGQSGWDVEGEEPFSWEGAQ